MPKARLSLSAAFKRFRDSKLEEVELPMDEEEFDTITPGQHTISHSDVEEGIDVVNSSQSATASQKSEHSDSGTSDQTSVSPNVVQHETNSPLIGFPYPFSYHTAQKLHRCTSDC